MLDSYYFQIKYPVYKSKLVPIMRGLEAILDCATVYYDKIIKRTVIETKIETRGVSSKGLDSKIDEAKKFLDDNGIAYVLKRKSSKNPLRF